MTKSYVEQDEDLGQQSARDRSQGKGESGWKGKRSSPWPGVRAWSGNFTKLFHYMTGALRNIIM